MEKPEPKFTYEKGDQELHQISLLLWDSSPSSS